MECLDIEYLMNLSLPLNHTIARYEKKKNGCQYLWCLIILKGQIIYLKLIYNSCFYNIRGCFVIEPSTFGKTYNSYRFYHYSKENTGYMKYIRPIVVEIMLTRKKTLFLVQKFLLCLMKEGRYWFNNCIKTFMFGEIHELL